MTKGETVGPVRREIVVGTGVVTTWDPPRRLGLTWQIGADWRYQPDLVTFVDIQFLPDEEPGRTRVVLEHGGLEGFGDQAEAVRAMFESPGAWSATLEALAGGTRSAA